MRGTAPLESWPRTLLFEVSWEVCNQVGGIYQVLRSKAPLMVQRWRHRYWLVGPYVRDQAELELEPMRPTGWLARVVEHLAARGLVVHTGRWLVTGRPRTFLLEHALLRDHLADLKHHLAQDLGIDPGYGDPLVEEVLTFAEAVRRLLEAVCAVRDASPAPGTGRGEPRMLAHFHEWLAGLPIPMLRRVGAPIPTVFTTHATVVGRYVASSEADFYDRLPSLDADLQAARYGVTTPHQIERACARDCGVLTTVSPITAEECSRLLGRNPDLITPNGLNVDRYDVGHDFQTLHAQYKEQIHRFVMGHFFPSYSFDLDRTLYFFNSGRFEPRNKGFDLSLETMARLNAELRSADLGVTVVFFLVTTRATRSLDPTVLHARGVLNELEEVSHRIAADVGARLFRRSAAGERVKLDELVDEYWRLRHRRVQHALHSGGPPPLVTHILEEDASDPVMNHIRALGFRNHRDDPVKVVYHPAFIAPVNPLWNLEYEQFVRGCHLGIFPSTYEPWGYTPLECVAMGVPAITSDLAGFGRYVADAFPDHDDWGLAVLRRRGRSFHEAAADLTRQIMAFCRLQRSGRIALRNVVEDHARGFDWSVLGKAYHDAHDRALATEP